MKYIYLLLIGLISIVAQGQDFKFGKVDVSEFETEAITGEKNPDAVVIYRKAHVRFAINASSGLLKTKTVHERILINNVEGLKYATNTIELYTDTGRKREKIKKVKGKTYNLVNGKISETKLSKKDVFL